LAESLTEPTGPIAAAAMLVSASATASRPAAGASMRATGVLAGGHRLADGRKVAVAVTAQSAAGSW
jgi:hypothetical protein